MNVEIDFERRANLLANNEVPIQSEIKANLGEHLGNVVLNTLPTVGRELMGVADKLNGPPELLWISPSDRLLDKIMLKPPITNTLLKAFTHEYILSVGIEIEKKQQLETEMLIQNAIDKTKRYERYETMQRVEFAVKEEQYLMEKISNEKINKLIDCHQKEMLEQQKLYKIELIQLECKLRKQFDENRLEIVKLTITETEKKCACQYEQLLTEKIIELNKMCAKKCTEAVEARKFHDIQILERLWFEFENHLKMDKTKIIVNHTAEMFHIICAEKLRSRQEIEKIQIGYNKKMNELQNEINLLKQPKPVIITKCPNIAIWKQKCRKLLENYENFIEHTIGAVPSQGKFFIDVERVLLKKDLDEIPNLHTTDGNYDCCCCSSLENSTKILRNASSQTTTNNCSQSVNFPGTINEIEINDKPFVIGHCHLLSPFSSVENVEKISQSSSLPVIEYAGKKYASIKHYDDVSRKLFPSEELIRCEWQLLNGSNSSSSNLSKNSQETNLNLKTKKPPIHVERKIIDTKAISEKILETILNVSFQHENNTKLNQIDFIKQLIDQELYVNQSIDVINKSASTKLLSAVDSVELLSKCIHRKLPSSVVVVHDGVKVNNAERMVDDIPNFSHGKLIEVQDSLEILHNKILQQQINNNKTDKLAIEKFPILSNDKYLGSFRKLPSYLVDLQNEIQSSELDIKESIKSNKNNERNDGFVTRFEEYDKIHKLSISNANDELLKRVQIHNCNNDEIPMDEVMVNFTKPKSILRTQTIASKKIYVSDHPVRGNIRMRTLLELMQRDENVTEILKENFFSIIN